MPIIKKFELFLIREMTEFNLQRMNPDSARASYHVDDPQLSINAFDKHEDKIRAAVSRLGDIHKSLQLAPSFRNLKGYLSLDDQNLQSLKILRIIKTDSLKYDVYISFKISDNEYWGLIEDITGFPELTSEVFKDRSLIQSKEWQIKTTGIIINNVKDFLKPQFGFYKLVNDTVIDYSEESGKLFKIKKGSTVEVLKSYNDRIIIKYNNERFSLKSDNFIYFNWWFEKISD